MKGILCAYLRDDGAEHAEGGGYRVAVAFDGQLDDIFAVKVIGILREAGAGGVLDALIHGENREIAGAAEAAVWNMRCRFARTRGLRSDTDQMRSTKSGPGRCRRSLEIFGELNPSRESAFAPRYVWMELVVAVAMCLISYLNEGL